MRIRIIGVAVLASVLTTCPLGGPLAIGALNYLLRKERGHLVRVAMGLVAEPTGLPVTRAGAASTRR